MAVEIPSAITICRALGERRLERVADIQRLDDRARHQGSAWRSDEVL